MIEKIGDPGAIRTRDLQIRNRGRRVESVQLSSKLEGNCPSGNQYLSGRSANCPEPEPPPKNSEPPAGWHTGEGPNFFPKSSPSEQKITAADNHEAGDLASPACSDEHSRVAQGLKDLLASIGGGMASACPDRKSRFGGALDSFQNPPAPKPAISRRAAALQHSNRISAEAKFHQPDRELYERLMRGEEISPAEIAEHEFRLKHGYSPSERWKEHERMRWDRILNPDEKTANGRKWNGGAVVPDDIRKHLSHGIGACIAVMQHELVKFGKCTLTNKAIAKAAGQCVRTVQRAKAVFKKLGQYAEIERPRGRGQKNRPNLLVVVSDTLRSWMERFRTRRTKVRPARTRPPITGEEVVNATVNGMTPRSDSTEDPCSPPLIHHQSSMDCGALWGKTVPT